MAELEKVREQVESSNQRQVAEIKELKATKSKQHAARNEMKKKLEGLVVIVKEQKRDLAERLTTTNSSLKVQTVATPTLFKPTATHNSTRYNLVLVVFLLKAAGDAEARALELSKQLLSSENELAKTLRILEDQGREKNRVAILEAEITELRLRHQKQVEDLDRARMR